MRSLIAAILLLSLPVYAIDGGQEDTATSRREAAERYAQVSDLPRMFEDMTENLALTLPQEKREGFKKLMTKHVRVEAVKDAMVAAMVKHFTTRELSALADFYGSPEGRSAMSKFGAYMVDVMPAMQAELRRAVAESQAESKGARSNAPR